MTRTYPFELFGQAVLNGLQSLPQQQFGQDQASVDRAIEFLTVRLTEAAMEGCHHCDEADKGAPCHWCGLTWQRKSPPRKLSATHKEAQR